MGYLCVKGWNGIFVCEGLGVGWDICVWAGGRVGVEWGWSGLQELF